MHMICACALDPSNVRLAQQTLTGWLQAEMSSLSLADLCSGLPLYPLPPAQTTRDPSVPHAPPRTPSLDEKETKVCLLSNYSYSLAV